MTVKVSIPTTFRPLAGGQSSVEVDGATIAEVIDSLDAAHPGFKERLIDGNGLVRFVQVYLADDDVRFLDGLETKVPDGETVTLMPAVAGG